MSLTDFTHAIPTPYTALRNILIAKKKKPQNQSENVLLLGR